MKKVRKIEFLSVILCIFLLLSGCNNQPAEEVSVTDVIETEDSEVVKNPEIKEFFEKYINTDERPIGIMIDNDDDNARPQEGLNDAYLIYELVVEGGSTRFLAMFRGVDAPKIGPVRSSRHYFIDYAMENDAIYTHFGWSPKAIEDIQSFSINNINGILGSDEDIFWREKKFKGDWHSAYTSIADVKAKAEKKNYEIKTTRKNGIQYAEDYFDLSPENIANEITLKYSGRYTTGYTYNAESGMYEKSIKGKPHVMQSGEVVTVKNIIVELINDTSLGDGTDRRNLNTTGTGKGYYFTNGAYEEITWSKEFRWENTTYTRADGSELLVNPGKTIINVISPSIGVVIQ